MNVTHWQPDRSLHCMNSCHLFVYLSIPTVKLCNIKRNQGMKSVLYGKIGTEARATSLTIFHFQSVLIDFSYDCLTVRLCVFMYVCLLSQRRKEVFNIKSISCLSSRCGRSRERDHLSSPQLQSCSPLPAL